MVLYAHRVWMDLDFAHYFLAAGAKGTVQLSSRHYPPAPKAIIGSNESRIAHAWFI